MNDQKDIRENCAVFGIRSSKDIFTDAYYGLYALQHRGQESAGIATYTNTNSDKGEINVHKDMGLVSEVFKGVYLEGNVGIGHVRYSTTGSSEIKNAQPLTINYAKGSFAMAHNGNILNADELKRILEGRGSIFATTTDTEIIAQLIAQEHMKTNDFIDGIKNAMEYLKGAYSLVILYDGKVIGVRDGWGFRPLVLGKKKDTYVISSESCALDTLDIKLVRDIKPSEIVVIGEKLESYTGKKHKISHCMFEYVYFSRPDSIMNEIPIYDVRKKMGEILARESPVSADLVIPVPDSGITASVGYSKESNIPYSEGLMKNRYVGRTFILPDQNQRERSVRVKLNPITSEIKDKKIVLIDDSIVRGTTLRRLIRILREGGVAKVHVRISCPPIRFPCMYGIDMQTHEEFIASKKSVEQIKNEIGADSLAYISLDGLIDAIGLPKEKLCLGCLTGDYPIKKAKQMKLG